MATATLRKENIGADFQFQRFGRCHRDGKHGYIQAEKLLEEQRGPHLDLQAAGGETPGLA